MFKNSNVLPGCFVRLNAPTSVLESPGRYDCSPYPDAIKCQYLVTSGSDDYFDVIIDHLDLDDGDTFKVRYIGSFSSVSLV